MPPTALSARTMFKRLSIKLLSFLKTLNGISLGICRATKLNRFSGHFFPAAGVPNLAMVEGVDNEKLANHLDRAVSNLGRDRLKVLVQVNTSGEISKSGVEPSGCIELAKHVKLRCPHLQFSGLMTIGMPDYTCTPENFKTLLKCRAEVCRELEMAEEQCELSMGMSSDFELAIEMGSTNVRIGSTIFGPREYAKKQAD